MRPGRPTFSTFFLFILVQTATAYGATLVSLGTSSNCGSLAAGQTCTLTALVTGNSNATVSWNFSPALLGSVPGVPAGPNANGLTTNTYTAPANVAARQVVTATVTSVDGVSASAQITVLPTLQVGGGAPSDALQYAFLLAYHRNGFDSKVALPPLAGVRALGSGGYVQEFSDAANPMLRWALVTASLTLGSFGGYANQVMQLTPNLYSFYSSIGAGTAGYPLQDAQPCPGFDIDNACAYALFDKNYALFAYDEALTNGQNFSVSGTFYTEWTTLGGILGFGRPISAQTNITATVIPPGTAGTTATAQTFAAGAIYSITSGPNRNRIFGVPQPVYDLYVNQSGPFGSLGLPTSELLQVSTGVYRQTFEGGALQYTSSGGGPVLQYPVTSVRISGAATTGTVTLNVGQTLTLTATSFDSTGTAVTDRPISWSTTNGRVLAIQANGATAVITAAGSGIASITASSQGVVSAKWNAIVIASCCQIGDGAPATIQQSFQDALARNKITVPLPAQSPAVRVANGYVQMLQSASGPVMVAQSDQLGAAYVVSGALLTRYQALGGPGGTLGYPVSDASAGGTQVFANSAALAGNPVRVVSGVILTKWTALGRENGAAGLPVAEADSFSTFGANSGAMQSFANGVIYGAAIGPRAGQAYLSGGLILARYNALGGPTGDFGMPVSDEFNNGGPRQQNFEGGDISYAPGADSATAYQSPKVPGVIVAPASIGAGGRARLAVIGFPNNSTVRVSVTGQPDFLTTTSNGAYSWEMFVPLTAKSGTLTIHAADVRGGAAADGVLTVKSLADNRIQISKLQGDNQTGMPGALLPLPLRLAILDASGNPVTGARVVFQASPGAQLSTNSAVTDSNGRAEVSLRLPSGEGVAAVTADAPSVVQAPVTFFARAAAAALSNFPKLTQSGDAPLGHGTAAITQKGALLTAVSSILRYRQNRGELTMPYGPADPLALNEYLRSYCTVDVKGNQLCDGFLFNSNSGEQIVNLWRAADFTGGVDVVAADPTVPAIADLLAAGSPVVLSVSLERNGIPAGGHFVVAMGVAGDGSIVIQDPSPLFARTNLNDYLSGFSAGGTSWKGTVAGAVNFALRSPGASRFLVAALSQPASVMQSFALSVQSAAGACGRSLDLLDSVDAAGNPPSGGALVSRIQVCDGSQSAYQINVGTAQAFRAFVTDLASAGSSIDLSGTTAATYKASRPQLNLAIAPQDVSFTSDAVVNAASFSSALAPGGIVSIFGSGLSGPGTSTAVEIDGAAAPVLAASPFQINAQIPENVMPGVHTIQIRSAYGTAQQQVAISEFAPAIFLIGNPPSGAVVNQDNSLNAASNPLARGQVLVIYATGLGRVVRQGPFSVAVNPVNAVVNGTEIPAVFAGLTPGFIGLYQVNVLIPTGTAPGLGISLALRQAGAQSNTVPVSIQ